MGKNKNLIKIRIVLSLVVLSSGLAACMPPVEVAPTASPMSQSTTPTTVPQTATSIHIPTETLAPTLTPAPEILAMAEDCDAGLLVVTAWITVEESGIYLVCADGSFMQQIVSTEVDLPDTRSNRHIAVSPDGQKLAFDAAIQMDDELYKSKIYLLDLFNYELTEVHSDDFCILDIDWSSDGQYLGYISSTPLDELEILHIDSHTITQIIEGNEFPDCFLADFDWSPDGTKINYRLDPPYSHSRDDLPSTNTWYVENITCDDQTHTCATSNQNILDWPNYITYRLSWSPDSSQLIGIGSYEFYNLFVEARELDGQLAWQIELGDILLSKEGGDFRDAVLSPDGKQIAFIAKEETNSISDIYILSLEDMSLFNVTDLIGQPHIDYYQVEWLPLP